MTLKTPENPRLNGSTAFVVEPTEWGAHVLTDSAASGRYRASFDEMETPKSDKTVTISTVVQVCEVVTTTKSKDMGYTGDPCGRCGALMMRRNGACTVCDSCGDTSGCS